MKKGKEPLTIEKLRTNGDNVIKAVFRKIDEAPNVAIIGDQNKEDPRKWARTQQDPGANGRDRGDLRVQAQCNLRRVFLVSEDAERLRAERQQ